MQLAVDQVVPIYGLNYKDGSEYAASWLDINGDPFRRTGADRDGRVAIDFGVYGVPETFVIDREGVIHYRHVGPLSADDLSRPDARGELWEHRRLSRALKHLLLATHSYLQNPADKIEIDANNSQLG